MSSLLAAGRIDHAGDIASRQNEAMIGSTTARASCCALVLFTAGGPSVIAR